MKKVPRAVTREFKSALVSAVEMLLKFLKKVHVSHRILTLSKINRTVKLWCMIITINNQDI